MPKGYIAEVIKLANNPGCPEFDTEKYILGVICKQQHSWGDTGKTLRTNNKYLRCPICQDISEREAYQKRKNKRNKGKLKIVSYTLFNNNSITFFNYDQFLLEFYITHGSNITEKTLPGNTHLDNRTCKYNHSWFKNNQGLFLNHYKYACLVCQKLVMYRNRENGRTKKLANKHYYKHQEKLKEIGKQNYYKNAEKRNENNKQKRKQKKELIEQSLLEVTYIGKVCKNCKTNIKYTLNQCCVKCSKTRSKKARRLVKDMTTKPFTMEELYNHLEKYKNRCAYCHLDLDYNSLRKAVIDHFIPTSKGGTNILKNLVYACQICNSSKGNRDPWIWYQHQKFYTLDRWKFILKTLDKNQENYQEIPYD